MALVALALAGCATPPLRVAAVRDFSPEPGIDAAPMRYLLYTPPGYDDPARASERWPLVVYLRGWPILGRQMKDIARGGFPAVAEREGPLPFVVVAPQRRGLWRRFGSDVHDLIDHIERIQRIDAERIYLAGVSWGAADAWRVAARRPERFAAMVLSGGWGDAETARRAAAVPTWSFHGETDFLIPLAAGELPVAAHRAAGGETRWTVLPMGFHALGRGIFAREDVHAWLLRHRRRPVPAAQHAAPAPGPSSRPDQSRSGEGNRRSP
jgi:predicted peptidase